uniref:J domain-containing protein n=1 Tax=Panagrolaimus sp. ES5 TaxID=591445 RepID=A0AC34FZU0_9BILA
MNFNHESGEENEFMKSKSANNSTLSLHIAAYENLIEPDTSDLNFRKTESSKQVFIGSFSSSIANPFEFPRQQKGGRNHPEVMQFKASQRLRNPNEANASNIEMPSSKKSRMSSLKSFKSSKSAKSAKTQPVTTTEAELSTDRRVVPVTTTEAELSTDRRVVVYDGPKHPKLKLKKNALYELLGVPPAATQNEIKKAYRQKILKYHPDKNVDVRNKEELNEKLGQLNRAFKILSDPTKRKIYDQYGIDAVQTFEETEISPSWLWLVYTRLGRDPEAPRQPPPPPPQSKIASIINTLSSKRVIKKKKKKNPSTTTAAEEEANGIPMSENPGGGQPTSIRVDPRSTASNVQSN